MPSTTLKAASEGTDAAWALGAGASKVIAVNSDDADVGYVKTTDTTIVQRQTFNHDQLPGGVAEINSHTLYNKSKRSAGVNTRRENILRYSGNVTAGACTDPTAAYTERADADLAVPGGGTWDVNIVNATEIGVQSCNTGVGAEEVRCTYLRWVVVWTPAHGGYMWLLAGWIPPILAMASHCLSKFEIARILSSLKTRPSNDEDFARIIEAFRRRPVYGY